MSLILFGSLIVLLVMGVPVAIAVAAATALVLLYSGTPLVMLTQSVFTAVDSFPLLALPFFILAGALMEHGGLSARIVEVASRLVGHWKGGLANATVVAAAFFAGLSGSSAADVAAIGSIMIPAMIHRGYAPAFAGAVASSGGGLGILIPPSIPMIIYALSAEVSVTRLFMAGFVPGLLVTVALILTSTLICRQRGYLGTGVPFSLRAVLQAVWNGRWALLMPVIILGGIYGGIFTPTEASIVAVAYSLVIGSFVYRELTWRRIASSLVMTAELCGVVLVIMFGAKIFGRLLVLNQIPQQIAEGVAAATDNWFVVLMIVNVFLVFVGTWMETLAQIILLTPILIPLVTRFGIDPIHFGILFVVNCEIGFITPPVGTNLFIGMGLAKVSLEAISRAALPYVGTFFVCVVILSAFPEISLFLPRLLMGR